MDACFCYPCKYLELKVARLGVDPNQLLLYRALEIVSMALEKWCPQ